MKTLIKTIAAAFIFGVVAFNQTAVAQVEEQGTEMQEEKQGEQAELVAITVTELPAPVNESIQSNYADWKPSKAYKTTDPRTQVVIYEIHFVNPQGATEKVRFDEEGEEVESDK